MTTLTVNIEDKKTEKAIKAVLDAFGLEYNVDKAKPTAPPLSKKDQQMYNRLKRSVEQINLYKEGKIQFQPARDFLNEL